MDSLDAMKSIEIDANDELYYTNDYDTVLEVKAAIERGETIRCWWVRSDGVRFEEDFFFNIESIRLIRTNRT